MTAKAGNLKTSQPAGEGWQNGMLDLGHVLLRLSLMTLERDVAVYVKGTWYIVFFYECLLEPAVSTSGTL